MTTIEDIERVKLYEKFDKDIAKRHYLIRLALVIDQLLNVFLWNGSQDETISSHIGRKIVAGKANWFEMIICKGLRLIENAHCVRSRGE